MWNICCAPLPAVAAIAFYYIGFAIVCAIVAYLFLSRITVLDLVNRVKSKLFYNITLIKKKTKLKTFLIYKEIQMGSGAKSYIRKGFLI